MFLSIILVGGIARGEFEKTIQSVLSQGDRDFELIICADVPSLGGDINDYYENCFLKNTCITSFIVNNSSIGLSQNWNNALECINGEFVYFLKAGDTLDVNMVSNIKDFIENNKAKKIDVIEFTVNLTGLAKNQSKTFLEKNKIYNLNSNFEPFSYTNEIISNKIYRSEIIKNNHFTFRPFVQFELLFVYKFLSCSKNYVHIETNEIGFADIQVNQVDYSMFDILKQWKHIMNYFRKIGKFKELKENIYYAYYKFFIDIWLGLIKMFKNKNLINKASDYAFKKFNSHKRVDFIKNNNVFKLSRDDKFKSMIFNFENYLNDIKKV